jgi:ubiquinone biosynthesis protein
MGVGRNTTSDSGGLGTGDLVRVPMRMVVSSARAWIFAFSFALAWTRGRLGKAPPGENPRRLRRFLERQGGAWIKLGQLLAMRADLLPVEYTTELAELLDNVPPFDNDTARRIIEDDLTGSLGRPVTTQELFGTLSEPVAAASFAQVYRARLDDGQLVAVKVQRPGLRAMILADGLSLRVTAAVVDAVRLFGSVKLGPQVRVLRRILAEELDYHFERESLQTAGEQAAHVPVLRVPRVFPRLCGNRVLTMEYLQGIWVKQIIKTLKERGEAGERELAERGVDVSLCAARVFFIGMRQIFEKGSFHADPHAANIVIMPGNVVGYVDFGIIGEMDDQLLRSQEQFFSALKDLDIAGAVDAMSQMIDIPENRQAELRAFKQELGRRLHRWARHLQDPAATIPEKSTGVLLLDTLGLIRRHRLGLLEEATRYLRALIISDMIMLQMDSTFDYIEQLQRYFRRRAVREFREDTAVGAVYDRLPQYHWMVTHGPAAFRRMTEEITAQRQSLQETSSRAENFLGSISRLFFGLAVATVAVRLFGVRDIGGALGLGFRLDWKLVAGALAFLWWALGLAGRR